MELQLQCEECNEPLEHELRVVAPGTSFPTLVVRPCSVCLADRETLVVEINDLRDVRNKLIFKLSKVKKLNIEIEELLEGE